MSPPSPDLADVTLALLAGGEGSRMGRPKATLSVQGQPILEYLADRLAWAGPTLLVTAPGREHPPGASHFARECIDPEAGTGPLRGVLTALEHATTPLLALTAVDMPAVRSEHLVWLVEQLRQQPHALAVMSRHPDAAGLRLEPFPCAMRLQAQPVVAQALASGMRSIHRLTHAARFVVVEAPADWAAMVWTNLNQPEEWESFIRGLAGREGES